MLSLIANSPAAQVDPQAGETFATPTIIHFSTVLALAGIMRAPWNGIDAPRILCGAVGLTGVVYAVIVTRKMRRQTAYQAKFEDWVFHVLLPFAGCLRLAVSAYAAGSRLRAALFGIGAAVLLLFIGIHNAWDAVTYHVFLKKQGQQEGERHR